MLFFTRLKYLRRACIIRPKNQEGMQKMIRFLHKDVQMMMLRFRLKMLKTAILTALVFVDQKPKPPPPRSLLIFELQNSACAPAASARMRIYLSYTRRHTLCRSHQNCSFPGGRPLLNDKIVVVKPVLKKNTMQVIKQA